MLEYSKLRRWHNLAHAGAWPARVLIHVIGVWVRFREGADVAARFRTWHYYSAKCSWVRDYQQGRYGMRRW